MSSIFGDDILSHQFALEYIVNHVFFPVYHPEFRDDPRTESKNAYALVCAVHAAARGYHEHIDRAHRSCWLHITKMLANFQELSISQSCNASWWECTLEDSEHKQLYRSRVMSQLSGMNDGDFGLFPGPRDHGMVFRREDDSMIYESLLVLGYPVGSAVIGPHQDIKFPRHVFDDPLFLQDVVRSLSDGASLGDKLHQVGHAVKPKGIIKRIGPDRTREPKNKVDKSPHWSRSALWFLIKVTIQLFLDRFPFGHGTYKSFMLFFMCNLANYAVNTDLSSTLLYSMSAKILRRFRKLGASAPQWLYGVVFQACTGVSRILELRQLPIYVTAYTLSPWDPSQLDLTKDIQHGLPHIYECVSISRANRGCSLPHTSVLPICHPRGTLHDFLSHLDQFSDGNDTQVTIHDVERAVREDIDDWVAHVTNIREACEQLARLACWYHSATYSRYDRNWLSREPQTSSDPDRISIRFLTMIDLWIALDKLVVKEVPILADYAPEVPIDFLCQSHLRDALTIHRACRAYQYVTARHSQSHPGWSVFSIQFTEDSFPCRFYDSSPQIQHLMTGIQDVLPPDPLRAKVVVFELQCPVILDRWRSVTCFISRIRLGKKLDEDIPICDIYALKPHSPSEPGWLGLYSAPAPKHWDRIYYVFEGPELPHFDPVYTLPASPYQVPRMQRYLDRTTHTSNEVVASLSSSHSNLSSPEFIAFAHLRSGGSLQWLNILNGLRSRTLNIHSEEVYLLLAQASNQVGPLDSTGRSLWHAEIEDPSFSRALLDELESLFVDSGVGSLDGPAMAIISLLTGVLASRSSRDTSGRAMELLRDLRRTTLEWVHELLYNVRQSPANRGLELLRDAAAICRSTFDVGSAIGHRPLRSAQDIEAWLGCALLIRTILPLFPAIPIYSQVLLNRDRGLSLILEEDLRDAIQSDPTNLGVDRAIQMVWLDYRPGPHRWEPLESPNSRWLVCDVASTRDSRSQIVHVNLLDGSLLVGGKPIGSGELLLHIRNDSQCRKVIQIDGGSRDFNLMLAPSDLPGMDCVTMSVIHGHRIHFALQYDDQESPRIIVQAEHRETGNIFELIPPENLPAHLPVSLIHDHVHWLNLSTSAIEIRPIKNLWKQSLDNWIIDRKGHDGQHRVTKAGEFLVGRQSPTWLMVSSRFWCLDDPENLIITASRADTTQLSSSLRLSITLSRYNLSFFVNEVGNLESCDFKDMVYDEDQCIGTLTSLVHRLVLRPKAQIEVDFIPKLILIPHGFPVLVGDHVHVCIPSELELVRYHTYRVDSELGRLMGADGLDSKLYLADLHALTSLGCRPDPLTGRMGVEEAASLVWLSGPRYWRRNGGYPSFKEDFQRHLASERSQSDIDQPQPWDDFLQQEAYCYPSFNGSPQLRFALERLEKGLDKPQSGSPVDDAVRREAYLFPSEVTTSAQPPRGGGFWPPLDKLFQERPPPNPLERDQLPRYSNSSWCHAPSESQSPDIGPLRQLFSSLRKKEAIPPFQSQYVARLHDSAYHFQATYPLNATYLNNSSPKPNIEVLRKHFLQCRIRYHESLFMVKMALDPRTEFEELLDQCGQWPRITPFVLFRCLASTSPITLSDRWKKCLIFLALLALDLQRARRLLRFALDNLTEELNHELENEGCDGWDADEHPDWLLIQLEGNFLIRRVQVDIAREIMSPRSGMNTVMQVNIGEGKTSVIIPICAAALADRSRLVRIIVPKPLIPQVLHVLAHRLSGLVGRPVYHLTSNRHEHTNENWKLNLSGHILQRLNTIKDDCGIVIMQPEHVLSLKLAGVEMQLPKEIVGEIANPKQGDPKLGDAIMTRSSPTLLKSGIELERSPNMRTGSHNKPLTTRARVASVIGKVEWWHRKPAAVDQGGSFDKGAALTSMESTDEPTASFKQAKILELLKFLETHARDILDESDEVLCPQLQLIYAIGNEDPFEGSPYRWLIIQQVFGLVKRHAYLLSATNSHAIHCDSSSPSSFPHIHFLREQGCELLASLVTNDVLDGRLSGLRFHSELGVKAAIRNFILRKDIHPKTVQAVEKYARQTTIWGSLLLLRGLFAQDILSFALTQRRWRVDYGLDPSSKPRTLLAIPYRAKDVPAESAEFGHPDVTILLTCLAYYYEGLSEQQLRVSFELLLQQDDPSSEYALWLDDCGTASVPKALRRLSSVNINLSEQWNKHLVPLFARNQRAIDLYLSKEVFPQHAKEFPQRISGSYWDIAERKNHLVTGFSGTNDGQYLFPTFIAQDDPDHLRQTATNARALACLLQPENAFYMVATDRDGERCGSLKLLETIAAQNPEIRVLLDVGAQILDLSNFELARAWLDRTPSTTVAGAVYFSDDDELMVLARSGTSQPLSASPLAQQLHRCVGYLDHSHTRGTDLKFPLGFRAAVTLGPKLTKDRLIQGCMRMRKLGRGHSVIFFAPLEVDQRIRSLASKENPYAQVTTADILRWTIHETWNDIQRRAPIWAQQGIDHQTRCEAWSRFSLNPTRVTIKELADAWLQPETRSLAEMYLPHHPKDTPTPTKFPVQIRERCENLGVLSLQDDRMDEEQEREVSREMEREREAEDPPVKILPAAHVLHPDVVRFVTTGVLIPPSRSKAFRHVFADVTTTSKPWSPYILATADFCETIKDSTTARGKLHNYLRPVQWILSGEMDDKDALVIVSPFEADKLMPDIRVSTHIHLHLYIPRITKRMKPSDDLMLYSIPPLPSDWIPPWTLIDQLNVFAGQLYLSDHTSYVRLCRFLGVHTEDLPGKAGTVVARNWFRNPDYPDEEIKNRFEGTLLSDAMHLLTVRHAMNFAGTHMGRILDGWPLAEEDFATIPRILDVEE